MDNYGDPVYDKNKILVGYKISENKFATIKTYYNDNNLLCNEVSIKGLGGKDLNLSLQEASLIFGVDTKTEFGFVREYNKTKYFYNKNNKLINVESSYSYPTFPTVKKEAELDKKIETIDFETYG
jgi:hypothetical protein